MANRNILRLWTSALKDASNLLDLISGETLALRPSTDDTGTVAIGDGTYSIDAKWFGSSANNYALFDVGLDALVFDGVDCHFGYNDLLRFGDSYESTLWHDGTSLKLLTNSYVDGLTNNLERRYCLKWVAGANGLPQLNAVTDPSGGNTYATADFVALLNADRNFEILGTNASSDDVIVSPEGGIKIETDGADNDQVIVLPHLNTGQSAWTTVTWGTDKSTEWTCHIKTGSSVATQTIWAGLKLTNTSVTATDNEQAFFRYAAATNSGKWQAISSIAGADDEANSGVTVAADTEYLLKISIDSSRLASFYINGVLVETSAALANTTDLIPYIGIQANHASAKHMYIFGQAISRVVG